MQYSSIQKVAQAFDKAATTYDENSHLQQKTAVHAAMLLRKYFYKSSSDGFSFAGSFQKENIINNKIKLQACNFNKKTDFVEKQLLLMDVGSATGYGTIKMADALPGSFWLGCDLSSAMVHYASSNNLHSRVCYRQANCLAKEEMQNCVEYFLQHFNIAGKHIKNKCGGQEEGVFDAITSLATLHWAMPIETAMKSISKYLMKDGLFLFSVYLQDCYKEMDEVGLQELRLYNLPSYEMVKEYLYLCGFNLMHGEEYYNNLYFESWRDFRNYQLRQGTVTNKHLVFSRKKKLLERLKNNENIFKKIQIPQSITIKNNYKDMDYFNENGLKVTSHYGIFLAKKITI